MEDSKASLEDKVIHNPRTLMVLCTVSAAMCGATTQMIGARKSSQSPEAMIKPAGPPTKKIRYVLIA